MIQEIYVKLQFFSFRKAFKENYCKSYFIYLFTYFFYFIYIYIFVFFLHFIWIRVFYFNFTVLVWQP